MRTTVEVLPAGASDADVMTTAASLLATMDGPICKPPLSRLLGDVCATCCPDGAAERAAQLELALAEYLNARHVLRSQDVSVPAVDAWAAATPLVVLRAALLGYARLLRRGGAACGR